jgi:methionyl-tRNA formyltransferase
LAPGAISTAEGLIVGTGSGSVALEEVQPATKKRMSGADFARGARLGDGARMGE